ncbi:hypothetical protein [Pseudomonas taiwanensis]|nr:hypothetical protein [Pseudomonas taiwanensis]
MFLCQHPKKFFKNRQKTTGGLMAFGDKGVAAGFLALEKWRFAE